LLKVALKHQKSNQIKSNQYWKNVIIIWKNVNSAQYKY
jgi:hypothetical protein